MALMALAAASQPPSELYKPCQPYSSDVLCRDALSEARREDLWGRRRYRWALHPREGTEEAGVEVVLILSKVTGLLVASLQAVQ